MAESSMIAWLCEFVGENLYLWSGDEQLTFDGNTYQPGHFISIQHASNEVGVPNRRTTASFAVVDPTMRAALLQDDGPVLVKVRFLQSTNRGKTWTAVGNQHLGRLSNPRLADGVYSVEIETYRGDIDRGRPIKWSHERQVKRDDEGDLAFEMASQLAVGIETRWPQ